MTTARILLVALLFPTALVAQETLLTVDRGQAYEFTWDRQNSRWVARVYVAPKPELRKTPIRVSLRSVAAGSRTDPGLTGLFQVSPVQPDPPLASFDILVPVPKGASVPPGTYQATLIFTAAKAQETANIQMTVPSAALTGPSTLQLTRVLFSPFDEDNPKLEIWETSGKSPADVQARQTEPFAGSDSQCGGQIRIDPATVSQDCNATLNYKLDDDFPMGAVSTKVTISSHQLQAPLVIPVQVRTRLTRAVLLIIIIVGLALGFLMRMVLQPRIETGEARKRAFEADRNLAESEGIPDTEFQGQIIKARSKLQGATQATTATSATIGAAITAAEAARQIAFENLQTRLKEAETKTNELAGVVTPAWTLPADIAETLTAAKEGVETAKRFLKVSDAGKALEAIQSAGEVLRTSLLVRTVAWGDSAARLLQQLAGLELLIQAERREKCAAARKALDDEVDKAKIDPQADASGLKAALEAVDRFTTALPRFVRTAADDVSATFAGMDEVIKDIALPKKELWDGARESTTKFIDELNSIRPEPSSRWDNIDLEARQLLARWRNALESQKPQADAVASAFDAGKYQSAARELEKALRVRVPGTTLDKAAAPLVREIEVTARPPYTSPAAVAAPEPAGGQAVATRIEPPKPFTAFGATSLRELMHAKAWQAVISGVALTIVGYMIFADKFVGTSGDLLTAFFWGFTTDIGVDALITAAKAKQPV